MCDYSLQNVKSRPAQVEDKLVVHNFGVGTRGFADASEGPVLSDATAICVLPGTEIAFEEHIRSGNVWEETKGKFSTAIFRQINKEYERMHHDALELPNGEVITLSNLMEGQRAKIIQIPVGGEERMPHNEGTVSYSAAARTVSSDELCD